MVAMGKWHLHTWPYALLVLVCRPYNWRAPLCLFLWSRGHLPFKIMFLPKFCPSQGIVPYGKSYLIHTLSQKCWFQHQSSLNHKFYHWNAWEKRGTLGTRMNPYSADERSGSLSGYCQDVVSSNLSSHSAVVSVFRQCKLGMLPALGTNVHRVHGGEAVMVAKI